ncbi:MAG: two-component system, OmpR family, response regulator [Actinomycetota bacterium]|jgi:DNA-binding response OmpR family regulator|nr:two-component system, OmpR family, response regulator [Actinomycetota bacterium]
MAYLRVLVVEPDDADRDLLVAILRDDGYVVDAVGDESSALDAAASFHPDLALISGLLPGGSGADVARRLRQVGDLPIIFVTGADSAEAIHSGFRMGADDYILKPFDPEELSWRVRAVLRRSGHVVAQVWECGDLVVDEGARSVMMAGASVDLTATEFKLLGVLIHNRTRVVPKGQLRGQVWDYDTDDHLVEVHMSSLRRKLEAHGPRMIHTIRGAGYVLRP